MAPLNPSSKPYNSVPTLRAQSDIPTTNCNFWPDGPTLFNHNSQSNMSSLRPPNLLFPDQLPPPRSIPVRAPPQNFDGLDAVYEKASHPLLGSQGIGCGGYNENEDESRSKDALKTLENHIKARTPYIQLASSRLQAACGVRNESPFDLPECPARSVSPSMQALCSMPSEGFAKQVVDKGGVKAKASARAGGISQKYSGAGFVPKSPLGMQTVDKETGKGLREFLLQKGKECGMRKRGCKSITFHDFTPDMRTGSHQNVLLGHYGVEKGERVDVYEVELPTAQVNPDTGEEIPATESWIWILISRPLVAFDPTDTSTKVPDKSLSLASPSSDMFYTPYSNKASPEPPTLHPTPPNFPHQTPLSWLVFAAPKVHVMTYPEATEDIPQPARQYPFATRSMAINKRVDYDFSFSGVPLFEFSSADMFTTTSKRTEFLSIERMGAWYENDPYLEYSEEEYKRMYSLWEDGEWDATCSRASDGLDYEGNPKASVPPPNRGVWWKVFYQRMHEDCVRWEKVKKAMGRGKCRVVVRWIEAVGEEDMETGQRGATVGKQGLGVGGKKGAQGKRLTRSESRRRSGLGLGIDPPVGSLIGIGGGSVLGESSKSRAAGNREMGRAAGVVGEKEKGKVRKR